MFKKMFVLLVIVSSFLTGIILVTAQAPQRKTAATLEVGTSGLCAYHTIGDAIAAASPGDTIKVENIIFTETLIIDKDLTIVGGYPQAMYGCLTLSGYGVTTLRGNAGAPTIRIENSAQTRLEWLIIENNPNGSAAMVDGATLDAENITIRHNIAVEGGGVHLVNATARLTDTSIANNQATRGGAIYAVNSALNGDNLTLQGNEAGDDGGALWAGQDSRVWFGNKTQIGGVASSSDANHAGKTGGAVYAEDGAAVTASDTVFEKNYAWDRGNGICITSTATFTAQNGTIIARHITQGGPGGWFGSGIYANGSGTRAIIDASYVLTNVAITAGGGLYLENGASATIQNGSEVRGNLNYDFTDGGAGVYLKGAQTHLTVVNSSIYTNSNPSNGGGIYNNGGVVELENATIRDNYTWDYGGGIYNSGVLMIMQSTVTENYVKDHDGGGYYGAAGSTVGVEQSTITNNRANGGNGGGFAVANGALSLLRSKVSANNANASGGAIWAQGGSCGASPCLNLTNNFIINNVSGGGLSSSAIYLENTIVELLHNTLAQTTGATYGVSIANNAGVELANNIISNFSVGIYESGGTSTVSAAYTNFYNNTTNYSGSVTSVNEVTGNPTFVGGGDYHIQETSAARNAGVNMSVTIDYDGDFRPQGGGYDIGADEYQETYRVFLPLIVRQ